MAILCDIGPKPWRVGLATVNIALTDAGHQPIRGAQIRIEGDMMHPGMAPVFSKATEKSPGLYSGTLDLTMPGDWGVLLHVSLPDGRKIEKQVSVRSVHAK
jgi:hypothetical protein